MASRLRIHSQLSSIMEAMAKSAVEEVCKLVEQESVQVRLELSQLLFANSALAEKVSSLECELTSARRVAPTKSKSYSSVGVQTVWSKDEEHPDATCPPTIDGIFGKDWCLNLWKDRYPFSLQRGTDSPDKPMASLSNQDPFAEIKEEELMPNASLQLIEENSCSKGYEESLAMESDKLSVGYSVNGSTCSLQLDLDGQDMPSEDTEETTLPMMSIGDTTEEACSTHIIPIEIEDDDEEDDDVKFVQASQMEAAPSPSVEPTQNKQQTSPTKSNEKIPTIDENVNNLNVASLETPRTPKKTFTCQICNRTFFHKGTLTQHMKSHKTNFCSICKQHFPQKKKLNSHNCVPSVPRHRISKSCEVCGKIFANRSALRIHYVVHTGEKPHMCSLCGKRFTQKGNLKSHLRIHTGERPFLCIKCGRAFTQKVNLNNHLMAHLNDEVVGEGSSSPNNLTP